MDIFEQTKVAFYSAERRVNNELYGDIPRRPLFLRFILETVSEHGVQHTGRAQLFYLWAKAKITRDILRPMRWGNIGREAIISESESSDTTLRLSFRAMMKAAYKMTQLVGNSLELLSDCTMDEVIATDEQLKNITDPTGLFLNSLLVPLQNTSLHSRLRIRFAHRAYQEFFLSLFIRDNSSNFHGAELPDAIKRLLISRAKKLKVDELLEELLVDE